MMACDDGVTWSLRQAGNMCLTPLQYAAAIDATGRVRVLLLSLIPIVALGPALTCCLLHRLSTTCCSATASPTPPVGSRHVALRCPSPLYTSHAELKAFGWRQATPLHIAARAGHRLAVEALLSCGMSLAAWDRLRCPPFPPLG
jgi:hypothetical protein